MMETLTNVIPKPSSKTVKSYRNGNICLRKRVSVLGSCSARTTNSLQLKHSKLSVSLRKSVKCMAKDKTKDKSKDVEGEEEEEDSPVPNYYSPFPEALLLKKEEKKSSNTLPDFAEVEDEELMTALGLQFESDVKSLDDRHYEIMYLIHEKHASEVQEVVSKVNDFVTEKKGKIWRLNDWGLRNLAYKIQKAKKANYILMNIEIKAEHINALNELLEKDERVIRHLVMKEEKAIVKDCPPPPEMYSADDDNIAALLGESDDELGQQWQEISKQILESENADLEEDDGDNEEFDNLESIDSATVTQI